MNRTSALILAERAVPRYTSYPTAPHFADTVNGEVVRHWMAALNPDASLSVYLHIPYCREMCAYCGCATKATKRDTPVEGYVTTLIQEIRQAGARTLAKSVRAIHWGGGTPSLVGPERFARIMAALGDAFDLSNVAEHAVELDPRVVTEEFIAAMAAHGVNRASLGVQDLNDHVQLAMGRVQPFAMVADCVAHLRAHGIAAINFDLMYGLPQQRVADVEKSAKLSLSLKPSRIASFGYAHVPWMRPHQKMIDAASLPGAAERLAQAETAERVFIAAGYWPIGLDHFALPDDPLAIAASKRTMRRNFQGYVTDDADALIGFGATSIGRLPGGYVQNYPDVGHWRRAVEKGELPVARGLAFSADDHARGAVIERLMCDFSIDFGALAFAYFGYESYFDDAINALDALAAQGVLTRKDRVVTMAPNGRTFVRLAAACFDAYLAQDKARHSMAV
jgi:oxygen-independent coproporphyrinogen-3 oxidase